LCTTTAAANVSTSIVQANCQTHQHVVHWEQAWVQQPHDAAAACVHDACQPQAALVWPHVCAQDGRLLQRQAEQRQQLQRLGQDQLHLRGQKRGGKRD
jgi:hypothetical protein